ncbi:YrbL family protein [Agrobacterium sp. ES01]|uniref:YrbL family protein n=1 Tax=Agrobacterium sp. ES01 TaxID=3420714 RepID=UPI003D0CE4B7
MKTLQFSDKIDLAEWQLIAGGASRDVYVHDDYPEIVLKVIRENRRGPNGEKRLRSRRKFYRHIRRFGAYLSFSREFDEFLEQARRFSGDEDVALPIARIYGFIHTTRGLGMLVERLRGPSGETAPTIRDVLRKHGPQPWVFELVDECFEVMRKHHIVMADCSPDNFVLTGDGKGGQRIVCIDGTGDKSAIHIYAVSGTLNALKLKRYRKRLQDTIDAFVVSEGLSVNGEELAAQAQDPSRDASRQTV